MKNLFFAVVGTALISSSSFAKTTIKEIEIMKTEVVKTEIKKTETISTKLADAKAEATTVAPPKSDWAGFVCCLFGGHCQPI
jgi:hypothetical protein